MRSPQKKFAGLALLVSLLFFAPWDAGAAEPEYPSKPVTLIVGFPAGGAVDLTARALVNGAKKHFPQPIIVENKSGAGGMVGLAQVGVKPPDGYTVGVIAARLPQLPGTWAQPTTTSWMTLPTLCATQGLCSGSWFARIRRSEPCRMS